ncbi:hypothetical protein [Nocardia sp. NPDC049707]
MAVIAFPTHDTISLTATVSEFFRRFRAKARLTDQERACTRSSAACAAT